MKSSSSKACVTPWLEVAICPQKFRLVSGYSQLACTTLFRRQSKIMHPSPTNNATTDPTCKISISARFKCSKTTFGVLWRDARTGCIFNMYSLSSSQITCHTSTFYWLHIFFYISKDVSAACEETSLYLRHRERRQKVLTRRNLWIPVGPIFSRCGGHRQERTQETNVYTLLAGHEYLFIFDDLLCPSWQSVWTLTKCTKAGVRTSDRGHSKFRQRQSASSCHPRALPKIPVSALWLSNTPYLLA